MRNLLVLALILAAGAPARAQQEESKVSPIAHIGHLRAQKQALDKEIIMSALETDADLIFAKVLADKARENGKRLGGEFEQKFEEDANTIEWDAQTKANEKKAAREREMEPKVRESKRLGEQLEKLIAEFLASPEGKAKVADWRRLNAKAVIGRTDREIVERQADFYHGVGQALLEKQAGR